MRKIALLVLSTTTACSVISRLQTEEEPVATPTATTRPAPAPSAGPARPLPYPVFESKGFARAVANGTRTRNGEPGPNYWQQFARYRIEAELVPSSSQVNGRETVRYFNRSPDTLRVPRFFLNPRQSLPASTSFVVSILHCVRIKAEKSCRWENVVILDSRKERDRYQASKNKAGLRDARRPALKRIVWGDYVLLVSACAVVAI